MKAVVFHGVRDVRLEDVPGLNEGADGLSARRRRRSADDPQFVRGTATGIKVDRILDAEGVGVAQAIGTMARNISAGAGSFH